MGRIVDQALEDLPAELRERELHWRSLLAECEASGLGVTAFARQRGVSIGSMFNWRGEIAKRDRARRALATTEETDGFLPVVVRTPSLERTEDQRLEVVVPGGRRVRVPPGFDAGELGRLIQVLEALPC